MDKDQELGLYQPIEISAISDLDENEEEIIKSYELYNNSIDYVRNGSEDIALICLKKAVAENKGFIEAYNLMAFISLINGNLEQAFKYSNIVLQNDEENEKALRYLQYIYDAKPEMASNNKIASTQNVNDYKKQQAQKVHSSNNNSSNKKIKEAAVSNKSKNEIKSPNEKKAHSENKSPKGTQSPKEIQKANQAKIKSSANKSQTNKYKKLLKKKYRFNLLAYSCVGVAIILIVFSIIFACINNSANHGNQSNSKNVSTVKKHESRTKKPRKVKKVEKVKKEDAASSVAENNVTSSKPKVPEKKAIPVANKPADASDLDKSLTNANNNLVSKNYAQAEDALKSMDKTKLTPQQQVTYQNIANKLYAADGVSNYQKGYTYFNNRDFNNAIPYLERYVALGRNDQYRKWVLYYLAKSYYQVGNKQKVGELSTKIQSEFPNSDVAGYVASWKNLK